MKKIFLLFTVVIYMTVNAQMYVSPGSYMYVNDTYVYVEEEVNLDSTGTDDGNIYLRNNSQLLQGTTGAGTNEGEGALSVYQEGTTNNFQYNYWCSPVGEANTTAANSYFHINQLNRPSASDKVTSTPATITSSYNGVATNSSLSISNAWIWTYEASNIYGPGTGGWVFAGNSSAGVKPGLGFTMKGTSGTDNLISDSNDNVQNNTGSAQRYDFRGKPNDGTISVAVNNVSGSYANKTLVGNPYPSAINLNYFLLENAGYTVDPSTGAVSATASGGTIDGNAYFWEHDKTNNTHNVSGYVGGYGTYAPTGSNVTSPGTYTAATFKKYDSSGELIVDPNEGTGNTYTRMFTPVGQGFMVNGAAANSTVTMKNLYRVYVREGAANNSQFERNMGQNAVNATTTTNPDNWEKIPNIAGIDYTQHSKLPAPQFKLLITTNDEYIYETAAAFNSVASDNYDVAFDALSSYTSSAVSTYFVTPDATKKLSITTQPFDIDKTLPIALKCDVPTAFNVKVKELTNFNLSAEIYLHDIVNDVYYDILNGEFDGIIQAGENADKYEVTFKVFDNLGQEHSQEIANSFTVFQNNEGEVLTINNPLNQDIRDLSVYDVAGKRVISRVNLGNNTSIEVPTGGLSEGVYIVNVLTNENISINKKIIVSK